MFRNYTLLKITVFIILLLTLTLKLNAQNKFIGEYSNHFGVTFKIKADSSFEYQFYDHDQTGMPVFAAGDFAIGKWWVKKDTIYLEQKFDTLRYKNNKGVIVNQLVPCVPFDNNPWEGIVSKEYIQEYLRYHQPADFPPKLLYRKNRLYEILYNGELYKGKIRDRLTHKKYPVWYKKSRLDF